MGVVWIQSRSPEYARKLSQIKRGKVVARGVAGGYLRTFEFKRGIAWAKDLINRYTSNLMPTNEPLNGLAASRANFDSKVV